MNKTELQPNSYYSASAIIREGFLGNWMKSRKTFTDLLRTERGQEVFKPIIRQGERMTFRIQGQTIIDVLKLIESGELRL